ncbi:glycosyltransferase [Coraliomargarita algicola]|uniref:glycosyltransferase n=1 Tax=Coraliomargarita algicola TaxID=3092156 RepID=UPI0031F30886
MKNKNAEDSPVTKIPYHEYRRGLSRYLRTRWDWRRQRHLQSGRKTSTFFSECRSDFRPAHFEEILRDVDIQHLHWTPWLIDWPTILPWMVSRAPIVWTLHDMNVLQGIWHYTPAENDFTPRLKRLDQQTLERKRAVLSALPTSRLVFVAPSRWLYDSLKERDHTSRFLCKCIPYGIDTATFAPIDKYQARAALGLPRDKKIVGFACESVADPRKGGQLLQQALLGIEDADLVRVSVGTSAIEASERHIALGRLDSDEKLALFYSSLDLFAVPSLQDNLPNTVLESMACGTPCVGFDVGGLPDMIRPGHTGFLAPVGDVQALSAQISKAVSDCGQLEVYGANCREVALNEYTLELQAKRYIDLYQQLLSEGS